MFLKYPSLENDFNLNLDYVDLTEEVLVSEKIDGSNFSIAINPDGSYSFASRNQLVAQTWHKADEIIAASFDLQPVIAYCVSKGLHMNIYGEVFSSSILKRIPYGKQTRIVFYDVAIDSNFLSGRETEELLAKFKMPRVKFKFMPLEAALKIDVESFESAYADSIAEGIVIKPYYKNYINDRVYGIKRKIKKFTEKTKKEKAVIDEPETIRKFKEYLNDNRVASFVSKQESLDKSKMPQYLKAIFEDAFEDFKKENKVEAPERDYYKTIGTIANALLKHIKI